MTSLFYSVIIAALLSITSLIAVLTRVSPLTSPLQAIPALFVSVFLSVASLGTLLFWMLWRWFPIHAWDEGKLLGIALRQGILLGCAVIALILFHLLSVLTWWIGILIFIVFVLVELALEH